MVLFRHKVNWPCFIKHLLNPGKNLVYNGVDGVVNKSRLQGQTFPGKPSVCMGLGAMVMSQTYRVRLISDQ